LPISSVLAALGALGSIGWSQRDYLLKPASSETEFLTTTVQPIDLRFTVTESGTLESASSINVMSEVEGQVAIISLEPAGTQVKAGDVVVELDSAALKTRRTEQQIVVQKARAAFSQAQQNEKVAISQSESDQESSKLLLQFARLDLEKYLKGDYPQQERIAESEITLAAEEVKRAHDRIAASEDLMNRGYLSKGQFEADQLTLLRMESKLALARTNAELLREYTFARTKRDLESKVAEAERALERTKTLSQAALDHAKTNLQAAESTLKLEESRLSHIESQIESCLMRAPQDGIVVYPIPEDDDLIDLYIKQGTVIRERQHVFSIPDTETLQVRTSIHEAIVNQLAPGMPARIWVDVFPDMEMRGEVTDVSPLPEPEDWRRSTVKFYPTRVSVYSQNPGITPGLTAKVEILIDRLDDVLAVPVQCVVQRGSTGFCYVLQDGRPELRQLKVGETNGQYLHVIDGLSAGEAVVLSPDTLGIPEKVLQEAVEKSRQEVPGADGSPTELPEPQIVRPKPESRLKPDHEVEYEAVLIGGAPGFVGEAQYEVQTFGDKKFYEFEVTITRGTPGAVLDVGVDGVVIGQATLDEAGNANLEWKTKKENFPENFPLGAGPGSQVTVGEERFGLSGALR
jgi:RND family efflux transporter MFP subunit